MDFTIEGLDNLNRLAADLGKADAAVVRLGHKAVAKTAADVERDAKMFAPVDTGNLRNSISTTQTGLAAEIGPTASYGHYVEFGTSRMAPHAYLGPAFDRHAHELADAAAGLGRRALQDGL